MADKDRNVEEPKEITENPEVEEEEEEEDLESLFNFPDEDEEEEAEEETEEEVLEETEGEEEEGDIPAVKVDPNTGDLIDSKTGEKLLPQSKVNEIIGNARIKGREIEEYANQLQQLTGMELPQITEYIKNQQVEKMVEETGMSELEAQRVVEDRQVRTYLEQQLMHLYNQQRMTQQMQSYNNEKMRYMDNPLVKKYEAEIDAIAKGGQQLGFEAAMNYVLGQKTVSGEILKSIQENPLKKTTKKPKVAPEGAGAGGVPSKAIPKELRQIAAALGVDVKEAAEEYYKEQKQKRR